VHFRAKRSELCNSTAVLTSHRRKHILETLRQTGAIIAKDLSSELGVSEDTIRRDLRELAAEGLLQRVHGGALPSSPAVGNFAFRLNVATDEKKAIGRAAAAMVRPGQVVILDGGTTAVQIARHFPPELHATVVTHSPTIAVELVEHPNVEVILIGGKLFKHSVVAVGAPAIENIGRIRADT
jgi:DeoR/GlpR family transcriptional regulator of sugar metabolism